jgi:NTP pyrophosphatase (non-canonical NTP hydrolase)
MAITTFSQYQEEAIAIRFSLVKFLEKNPGLSEDVIKLIAVSYDGLGLGEAGEVQGKIKKIIRDNCGVITEEGKNEIIAELGDTLYYIASMCNNLGTTLEEVATHNIEKIKFRKERGTLHGSGDNR